MRTPLIAGNWKMYKTVDQAIDLVKALLDGLGTLPGREVVVCPPYTALYPVASLLAGTPIGLGAQDVFYEPQGAYTSAISPLMLRDIGCQYVIVGHSERSQISTAHWWVAPRSKQIAFCALSTIGKCESLLVTALMAVNQE